MRTYKILLIVAAVFGGVALVFAAVAIPNLCRVIIKTGEARRCSGHLYGHVQFEFEHSDDIEDVRRQVLFIFHIMAFACGAATVIMIIVALCTKMARSCGFMVATMVLAALTSLDFLVTAIVMTLLYLEFKNRFDRHVDSDLMIAESIQGDLVHTAMFWTAFATATTALICVIIAFVKVPKERNKTRGRKGEKERGKKAGKKRGGRRRK